MFILVSWLYVYWRTKKNNISNVSFFALFYVKYAIRIDIYIGDSLESERDDFSLTWYFMTTLPNCGSIWYTSPSIKFKPNHLHLLMKEEKKLKKDSPLLGFLPFSSFDAKKAFKRKD